MNLRHLQYLQLVIRDGGIGAAARSAGVSQPAITQAMQSLERELGFSLFDGKGWRKKPTDAALKVARRAQLLGQGLGSLAANGTTLDEMQAASATSIRFGLSPVGAQLYAAKIAAGVARQAPAVRLQLSSGTAPRLLEQLQYGDLALAITPRPRGLRMRGLHSRALCSSTPAIYARKDHPLIGASALSELKEVRWVMVGAQPGPGCMIEEAFKVRQLAHARVQATCDDFATCLRLVAESDMMCVVPHPVLVESILAGQLQRLSLQDGLPRYDISAFFRADESEQTARVVCQVVEGLKHFGGSVAAMDSGVVPV